MNIALSSSHSEGSPKPESARPGASPPSTIEPIRPIRTTAAAGSGWRIRPLSVAANTPNCRHCIASTEGGRGQSSTTPAYTAATASRRRVRGGTRDRAPPGTSGVRTATGVVSVDMRLVATRSTT
jgi:hypothetical protein